MAEKTKPASLTLDLLPQELLVHIMSFPQIEVDDLLLVSRVCSKFRDVVRCDVLWKKKFACWWPELFRQYSGNTEWRVECLERHCCGLRLRSWMAQMSRDFYAHDELSEDAFRGILSLSDHPRRLLFFIDELAAILEDDKPHEDLTLKYYARRVRRHVCHQHTKQRWESYMGSDGAPAEPSLEDGALLLSQWCQPLHRVPADWVRHTLDELARRAKAIVTARHPRHPLVRCDWQLSHTVLQESRWSPGDCRSLLACINQGLFHEFGLTGDRQHYNTPENSFIDKVLEKKCGNPLTLCIIYQAVAKRLGVLCLPVNFPTHFLLKWLEHPHLPEEQRYTYIDVYHGGRFMVQGECPSLCPNLQLDKTCYSVLRTPKVLVRMCWNLVEVWRQFESNLGMQGLRYALELLEHFQCRGWHRIDLMQGDIDHRLLLARVYLHLGINNQQIVSLLRGIEAEDPASRAIVADTFRNAQRRMVAHERRRKVLLQRQLPKLRSEPRSHAKIAYAVGMIMRHKKFHYHCVIYGWSSKFATNCIFQLGSLNRSHEDGQPFYNVLVEDGSNRLAAQYNLEISTRPEVITHPDVGKYFERFCGTHYLPNAEMEHEYPEDAEVRQKLLFQAMRSRPYDEEESGSI